MATPNDNPTITATKRASDAYCELIDALEELKKIDAQLYRVSLHYTLKQVLWLTQQATRNQQAQTTEISWVKDRPL